MCDAANPYVKLVPWNSTVYDNPERFGASFWYTVVSFVFMIMHYVFVHSTWTHMFRGGVTDRTDRATIITNKTFNFFFGIGWAMALYGWGWGNYYSTVACAWNNFGTRTPQDTFNLVITSSYLAILLCYGLARLLRKHHFQNSGRFTESIYFFSQTAPKTIFFGTLVFKGAYVYKTGLTNFPTSTSQFGVSLPFYLVSTILLALAPVYPWLRFTSESPLTGNRGDVEPLIDKPNAITESDVSSGNNAASLVSTYLFWNSKAINIFQKGQLRRLVGELELMPMTLFWFVAFHFEEFSAGYFIYSDNLKPVVYWLNSCMIPTAAWIHSRHDGVFIPIHVAQTYFILMTSVFMTGQYPGSRTNDADPTESWQKAVNYSIMTTGPYPPDVESGNNSVKVISGLAFGLSIFAFTYIFRRAYYIMDRDNLRTEIAKNS